MKSDRDGAITAAVRKAAHSPQRNHVEQARIEALDAERSPEVQWLRARLCRLVCLLRCRICSRRAQQKLLADYVRGRRPGGPSSLLYGTSPATIARIRGRLVRALIAAIQDLAAEELDAVQRGRILLFRALVEQSLRHHDEATPAADKPMAQDEVLEAWVNISKGAGVDDEEFLIPSGRETVT